MAAVLQTHQNVYNKAFLNNYFLLYNIILLSMILVLPWVQVK